MHSNDHIKENWHMKEGVAPPYPLGESLGIVARLPACTAPTAINCLAQFDNFQGKPHGLISMQCWTVPQKNQVHASPKVRLIGSFCSAISQGRLTDAVYR